MAYQSLLKTTKAFKEVDMSKTKNKSRTIQEGTIVRTRDSNFLNGRDTKESHPNNKDFYRGAIVVETTIDDKLGVVKTTSKGTIKIDETTSIKPFLEIFDREGRYIRINARFVLDKGNKLFSKEKVNMIKRSLYKSRKTSKRLRSRNKALARILKGRK